MKYTKEQMENRLISYLTKTEKHLFIDEIGKLKTVITNIDKDGVFNYHILDIVPNGENRLTSKKIELSINHTESLADLQYKLFPNWIKRNSIPYYKKMKINVNEIKDTLNNNNNILLDLLVKNVDLEFTKE